MLRAFVLSLVFLCGSVYASEPPSPAPPKAGHAQQYNGGSAKQPSASDKSETNLPAIIVNVIQPSDTEEQQRDKRQEREEKSTFERWNTTSTIVIAFFTVILAISTIGLWLDARKGSKAATKAANAAEIAATSNRAWLYIEYIVGYRTEILPGSIFYHFQVEFRIINSGQTPAIVNMIETDVYWLTGPMPFNEYEPIPATDKRFSQRDISGFSEKGTVPIEKYSGSKNDWFDTSHPNQFIIPANSDSGKITIQYHFERDFDGIKGEADNIFLLPKNGHFEKGRVISFSDYWFLCIVKYIDIHGIQRETSIYGKAVAGTLMRPKQEQASKYNYWK